MNKIIIHKDTFFKEKSLKSMGVFFNLTSDRLFLTSLNPTLFKNSKTKTPVLSNFIQSSIGEPLISEWELSTFVSSYHTIQLTYLSLLGKNANARN